MRSSVPQPPAAPRRRPRRAGRPVFGGRLGSLLFALGLLVVQLGSAAHLILVEHARCAHGELTHGHGDHAAPAAGAHEDETGADSARGDDPDPAHDEDHCDALAVTHRVPDAPSPVGAATVLATLPVAEPDAPCEIRPIGLLDVAPKGSPPAA